MNWTTGEKMWLTPEAPEYLRPVNMWGTPLEACEYVGHPFYQGVNAIVITLLCRGKRCRGRRAMPDMPWSSIVFALFELQIIYLGKKSA